MSATTVAKSKKSTPWIIRFFIFSPFKRMNRQTLGQAFYARLLYSAIAVFATYNPVYSLYQWLSTSEVHIGDKAMAVFVASIIWGIYYLLSKDAIGKFGIVVTAIIFSVFFGYAFWKGWLDLTNVSVLQWVIPTIISLTLAVSLTWAIFRRRSTGVLPTDEVDE